MMSRSACFAGMIKIHKFIFSHTFCTDCFVKWTASGVTCPVCRAEINTELIGKDLITEKIIQDLEVQCINRMCDWKGRLESLGKHVKTCPYEKPPEWLNNMSNKALALHITPPKDFCLMDVSILDFFLSLLE
jgi:hypothetical protein